MSLLVASGVMALDGTLYCALGISMIYPACLPRGRTELARLYPSLFRFFLFGPPVIQTLDDPDPCSPMGERDQEQPFQSVLNGSVRPLGELQHDLGFRLLAYLLLLAGVCRLITGFHWGCGYIYLGLGTCLAEIGMVCNELLREESMLLHRAMGVLLSNMVLSLVYLSAGLPHCSS